MFYFFTILILSIPSIFTAGPFQSKQTIYPNITTNEVNEDSDSSISSKICSTIYNTKPTLYYQITVQEFDKNSYKDHQSQIIKKNTPNKIEPLATLTQIYASRKNNSNQPIQYCIQTDDYNSIELYQEEKEFIYENIAHVTTPSNIIFCKPIIQYTKQPQNKVRFMYLTCPHNLNNHHSI